jgi:hypothetical protein
MGFFAFLPTYILNLERVHSRVTSEIGRYLDSDIKVKAFSWQWLPLPRLVLTEFSIESDRLDTKIPKVSLSPDWLGLIRGKLGASQASLDSPYLYLKSLTQVARKELQSTSSLSIKLIIKNGSLDLNPECILPRLLKHTNSLKFSNIKANIDVKPDRVNVSFKCIPPYGKEFETAGYFIPSKGCYELRIYCQGLQSDKILLTSLGKRRFEPLVSDADIEATINGKGFDDIKALIKGDFPALQINLNNKKTLFSSGHADLSLRKQGQEFQVRLNAMKFADPAISLSGIIKRLQSSPVDRAIWHIDLQAKEVDLSGARERVLVLFGEHRVVKQVCSTILGGKATKLTYYFEGAASNLRELNSMIITADLDKVPIHVPVVDMDLEKTSGRIEIQDAILTGQNLSARTDNSLGTNGSIELGLTGDDKIFRLVLDVDADLSKLPTFLNKVIKHQWFKNELNRFSDVQGRASGRLILGDRLKSVTARINVSSIDGKAHYQQVTWPIHIREAQLRILPHKVDWSNVQGIIGPHSVHEMEGSVTWKQEIFLDIKKFDAHLDSGPFLEELKHYPRVEKIISNLLISIGGLLEVTDARFKGFLKRPSTWEYSIRAETKGLDLRTPSLPGPSAVEQASTKIDNQNVQISSCKMWFMDQPIKLTGGLKHQNWKNWQGWLQFSGTAKQSIASWIKAKGWIPDLYFPRTPCTLNNLRVAWDSEKLEIRGEIISGLESKNPTKVNLDIWSGPESFSINDLMIITPSEKANFSLNMPKIPGENFLLNWEGYLKGETVDRILEENRILTGHIRGSYNLSGISKDLSSIRVKGSLKTSNLYWYWGVAQPIVIKYANLTGYDESWMDIKKLYLGINGESIISTGRASFLKNNVDLEMDLQSASLSWKNLSRFITEARNGEGSLYSHSCLTGRINFNIDRFKYTTRAKFEGSDAEQKSRDFLWQPLIGQIKFLPSKKISASISSGVICGLNTTGTWYSSPDSSWKTLSISTDEKLLFQKVLSCLGFKQDIIEGTFMFNANLEGTSNNWQRGSMELQSFDGRIRRMTLLSRIFSLLNVIDLFSKDGFQDLLAKGLSFSQMNIKGNIDDNKLIIDNAIIKGQGLNLFGSGEIDLGNMYTDMTVLVAPLKTIDTIVSKVPLLGKAVGGKNATIVAFPVKIEGQLKDPQVKVLSPAAVGEAIIDLAKNTLMLPFNILSPILP